MASSIVEYFRETATHPVDLLLDDLDRGLEDEEAVLVFECTVELQAQHHDRQHPVVISLLDVALPEVDLLLLVPGRHRRVQVMSEVLRNVFLQFRPKPISLLLAEALDVLLEHVEVRRCQPLLLFLGGHPLLLQLLLLEGLEVLHGVVDFGVAVDVHFSRADVAVVEAIIRSAAFVHPSQPHEGPPEVLGDDDPLVDFGKLKGVLRLIESITGSEEGCAAKHTAHVAHHAVPEAHADLNLLDLALARQALLLFLRLVRPQHLAQEVVDLLGCRYRILHVPMRLLLTQAHELLLGNVHTLFRRPCLFLLLLRAVLILSLLFLGC